MRGRMLQGGNGGGGAQEAADRRPPNSVDPGALNALLVEDSIDRCCDHLVAGVYRLAAD